jgi:hypothetical protein
VGETAEIADFSQGYTYWKTAFDEGKAGVFKITVRQALDGLLSGNWEQVSNKAAYFLTRSASPFAITLE